MPRFIEKTVTVDKRNIICKYCGNEYLWKNGTQSGDVQYYWCPTCERKANGKDTYPHMKYDRETIIRAMTYYYNGISFQGIQNVFDDLYDIHISTSTLWEWVNKYTKLVIPFTIDIKPPHIGNIWFADETQLKVNVKGLSLKKKEKKKRITEKMIKRQEEVTGKKFSKEEREALKEKEDTQNKVWLWAVIDEKTKYVLSSIFTRYGRTTKDATRLFQQALQHAGKRPTDVITDHLQSYEKAFTKVFYSRYKEDRVFHYQSVGIKDPLSTLNVIERWHEYVKQRYKIMRHFKREDTADTILKGIIINYNWLWEHSGIKKIAPIQKAGINVEKLNIKNWGDLIDLAYQYQSEKRKNPTDSTFWINEQNRMDKENDIEFYWDEVKKIYGGYSTERIETVSEMY